MQMETMGKLPADVAEAGLAHDPSPDYIAEAATPSEDVWAREETRYRQKDGET